MKTRKRILVIDDTDANRYVLKKILDGQAAYEIIEAGSGEDGLALMDADIDLVIIDINLPDMTGFDLIQAAEKKLGRGKLPSIINISATFVSGKDKATGLNRGAQAYLTHPINPDEVIATISSLLKNNHRFERVEQQRNVAVALSQNLQTEKIMLERFMRSLSHDLRSPLTAASMVVGLMQKNPTRRSDEMLGILEKNLQRMSQMITNVLDISHVSLGGGLQLNGETFAVGRLLEDAIGDLRIQIGNELRVDLETPDAPVFWDRHAFLRIIDNLVINAAKHGSKSAPIFIEQRHAEGQVLIRVRNAGSIPGEVLANLATPYFISTKSDVQGWGLGLPTVKALCESFGGHVEFSSEAEEVVVDVYLPASLPARDA
jgi:two-component system sensor histidine kinase/response regulator